MIHCTLHNLDIQMHVEPEFLRAYEEAAKLSGLGPYRMRQLWQAVGQSAKLPIGDLLEVGTYKGGSALLIARAMKYFNLQTSFTVCDTFAGLVKADPDVDVWKNGEMAQQHYEEVCVLLPEATVLRGVFPDETGQHLERRTFRFAHIDVDIYQSAKDIWSWLWPRLEHGAIVVFDDVEVGDTPGITRLVSELERLPGAVWLRNNMWQALAITL